MIFRLEVAMFVHIVHWLCFHSLCAQFLGALREPSRAPSWIMQEKTVILRASLPLHTCADSIEAGGANARQQFGASERHLTTRTNDVYLLLNWQVRKTEATTRIRCEIKFCRANRRTELSAS